MSRIPFGIPGLDQDFDGIPQGSFVLLTGEVDSGVDEFAYTSTAMIQMARDEPAVFRSYNDLEVEAKEIPEKVHYISLERHEDLILEKLRSVLNEHQYNALVNNMNFVDLTDEYFDSMPLSLPADDVEEELGYHEIVEKIGEYLEENASGDIVLIDSVTSLFKMAEFGLGRKKVLAFLTWLADASRQWGGMIYAVNHTRPTGVRDDPVLAATPDGIMYFSVSDIGGGFHRKMYMGSFRGTLSKSQERIKIYDASISGRGFQVSTVNEVI